MDNYQPPAPPTEAPSSQLNTTSPPPPPTPPPLTPPCAASNATVPQSSTNRANIPTQDVVQTAINATMQAQNITPPHAQAGLPPTPAQPQSVSPQTPGFSQKEVKPFTWRALAKLIYIIMFITGALVAVFLATKNIMVKPEAEVAGDILLQTRYQPVLWKDFGEVFEPIIEMPLYYPSEGFVKHKFLLDSGALVSSLPREEAKKMGLSLAKLPRSTFGGFGGTTSFAYKAEAKIKLGEQEIIIPVVFTEAGGTKSILGRSGFFEKYSVYFNSKREMIEIRK